MRLALAILAAIGLASPAQPMERTNLGWGRLFNNDAIGDTHDRWRTGSYVVSLVRGVDWNGRYPGFGEMLEWRFRTEVIAPANLINPATGDRRYAGVLSFGLHTHFATGPLDNALGVDLVATGPQTGVGNMQRRIHDLIGLDKPRVLGDQIANAVYPTLIAETGHVFRFSETVSVRPFAEVTAGVESMARIGGDILIGGPAQHDLMLRDETTGQRYTATRRDGTGLAFAFGGDVAKVWDSKYLPDNQGYVLSDARVRMRAGLFWQGEKSSVFYGVTWLGKEFEGQPEGQVVGSLRLNLRF